MSEAQSRWTGEFVELSTELAFIDSRWKRISRQLQIVSVFCIAAHAFAALYNFLELGLSAGFLVILGARLFSSLNLIWIFHDSRRPVFSRRLVWAVFLGEVMVAVVEATEYRVYAELGRLIDPLAVPFFAFVVLLFFAAFFNRLVVTVTASLIGALIFSGNVFLLFDQDLTASLRVCQTIVVTTIIGFVAMRTLNLSMRSEWSNRIELEKEIIERQRASAAKDRFLAVVSHEFRTPLQGILGMADLLQTENTGRAVERALAIEVSGKHLLSLLNNVLDVVQARGDGAVLREETFDLAALVYDSVELFQADHETDAKRFSVTLGDGLPRWVHGDGHHIRRVLINLISNASKYSGKEKITVSVEPCFDTAGALKVAFAVADRGPGIAEADRSRIFDEFVRLVEFNAAQPGIGLGLAICRRLVILLKGDLSIACPDEGGSVFTFTIPLAATEPSKADAPAMRRGTKPFPLTVLLVEDMEINREVVSDLLERAGCRVAVAETGHKALKLATEGMFDLILTDINLPDISGIEVARGVRSLADADGTPLPQSSVPIVALSASVFPEDKKRCLAAGMNDMLVKPLDPAELQAVLGSIPVPDNRKPETTGVVDGDFIRNELDMFGVEKTGNFLRAFQRTFESERAKLHAALTDGDAEKAVRAAHRIAGLASNFGMNALVSLIRNLERAARDGDLFEARTQAEKLPDIYAETLRAFDVVFQANLGAGSK